MINTCQLQDVVWTNRLQISPSELSVGAREEELRGDAGEEEEQHV